MDQHVTNIVVFGSNTLFFVTAAGSTWFYTCTAVKSAFHGGSFLLSLPQLFRLWRYVHLLVHLILRVGDWPIIFFLVLNFLKKWLIITFKNWHIFCAAVLPFLEKTTFFLYPIGVIIVLSPICKFQPDIWFCFCMGIVAETELLLPCSDFKRLQPF